MIFASNFNELEFSNKSIRGHQFRCHQHEFQLFHDIIFKGIALTVDAAASLKVVKTAESPVSISDIFAALDSVYCIGTHCYLNTIKVHHSTTFQSSQCQNQQRFEQLAHRNTLKNPNTGVKWCICERKRKTWC
ncbi:Hypothetical_protein [Hexamita inflata]|uniref:Hypothetical_protein n=1 Tax=Hexamita inflata TaxID=28002 RepID=A0AA86Q3A5_9EUKA|nr:Hypothetical protein HINF_LOCUS37421 [Hexamita inflata]